jgi:ribosomal protein S9
MVGSCKARVRKDKGEMMKNNQAALVKVIPDIVTALQVEERFNIHEVITRFNLDRKMGRHTVWQALEALRRERRIDFRPVKGGGGNYERVRKAKHSRERALRSRAAGIMKLTRALEKVDCVAINDLTEEEKTAHQSARDKVAETILQMAIAQRRHKRLLPEGL